MKLNNPGEEYKARLNQRNSELTVEEKRIKTIWMWRRILLALILISVILAIETVFSPFLISIPVIAFIVLMVMHQGMFKVRDRLLRSVKYYERCIARLENGWSGSGNQTMYVDKSHPYAEDLDIFGTGSLFELLSEARTEAGERILALWLTEPADVSEIIERQKAVDELRDRIDLREDMAILGSDVRSSVRTEDLKEWTDTPPQLTSKIMPVLAAIIGSYSMTSIILWLFFGYGLVALIALFLLSVFLFFYKKPISNVIMSVDKGGRNLKVLSELLARIEAEQFSSPRLMALRAAIETDGLPPSKRIARLMTLVDTLDSTKNQFFALFTFILLVPAQLAYAIDKWRRRSNIHQWLDAVAEIEALSCLAGFAYEHPQNVFPEFTGPLPYFEATGIGHPLIADSQCVRNDVKLNDKLQLIVVSGSNMSGKSTLMRSIGINVVLAQAGAPVCANRLKLSPIAIGASIHILDSLQSGASRFYAEITRMQQIVKLTEGRLPLLFLLDEILSGTNSHDRRIGAEAIIKGLVERGAIGIVTTHDLALTKIVDSLENKAINVHFEDHLDRGRMIFDYKIRPGIVQRSNAIELMRAVGLNV